VACSGPMRGYSGLRPCLAPVIVCSTAGVAQHGIRFHDHPQRLGRARRRSVIFQVRRLRQVPGVGVVSPQQTTVGAGDLRCARVSGNSQHVVCGSTLIGDRSGSFCCCQPLTLADDAKPSAASWLSTLTLAGCRTRRPVGTSLPASATTMTCPVTLGGVCDRCTFYLA
jgi:hypothetical protein